MKALLSFVFFLTLTGLPADAEEDPITGLSKIEIYAFGGVGFGGTTSEGEIFYDKILSKSTARTDFVTIAETGTVEAKLYALHALAQIAPADYARFKKDLRPNTPVTHMVGCDIGETPTSTILLGIEKAAKQAASKPKPKPEPKPSPSK